MNLFKKKVKLFELDPGQTDSFRWSGDGWEAQISKDLEDSYYTAKFQVVGAICIKLYAKGSAQEAADELEQMLKKQTPVSTC